MEETEFAETSFDLVVVGGGPGGYVAAIRAAQLGMRTALVEREHLGGICLNWGCIPTKALLRSSEIYHLLHHLDDFGFSAKDISYDAKKVVARSRAVAKQLSNGVALSAAQEQGHRVRRQAKLAGKGKLAVAKDGKPVADLDAPHIVLATGARARSLPGLEPDGKLVWTYKEAMVPEAIPKSLLVVGSGAIGIEFASFYRDMGAEVTVVEVLDRVLPVEDEEISAFARKSFEKQGIKIHTGATVKALERGGERCHRADRGRRQSARSRRRAGDPGGRHRRQCRGHRPRRHRRRGRAHPYRRRRMAAHRRAGPYAIGDVVGPPWLAHKASHEGVICVEQIAGVNDVHPLDVTQHPGLHLLPAAGRQRRADREGGARGRVRGQDRALPVYRQRQGDRARRARGHGQDRVRRQDRRALGAHMVGAEVTELIQGYTIAKTLETTEAELIRTIFPHPTLSETMHEAVLDAYGRAIHF